MKPPKHHRITGLRALTLLRKFDAAGANPPPGLLGDMREALAQHVAANLTKRKRPRTRAAKRRPTAVAKRPTSAELAAITRKVDALETNGDEIVTLSINQIRDLVMPGELGGENGEA